MNRLRFRFTKTGKIRFTSHRDVARAWERAIRRAALPIAYSEGFSPRPRLHFGLALSTGYESMAEYLEMDLVPEATVDLETLPARLSEVLPAGIEVLAAGPADPGESSLQEAVTSCSWELEVVGEPPAGVERSVEALLLASSVPFTIERKGRPFEIDLRPLVTELVTTVVDGDVTVVTTELLTQPRAVRPAELLAVLSPGLEARRVCRLHQWMSLDGARREPLPVGATRAPRAEACA